MVFSDGFHGTPLCGTNGSAGYLMQLRVNIPYNFFTHKSQVHGHISGQAGEWVECK